MPLTQLVNIRDFVAMDSPAIIRGEQPASTEAHDFVVQSRGAIEKILNGEDSRLIVIVGPCSIHDEVSCMEYAERLSELAKKVSDQMLVVMRVFFEKPRTAIGWKGLINDPHLDNSFDILEGLRISRRILLKVTNLRLPVATEVLEPVTPLYISDLIAVATIGARTTESPTHRQMASGLSMPVGHKNGTDGGLSVALDAMKAARHPHSFVGINDDGVTCIIHTRGNRNVFPILRGGHSGPNYSADHVAEAVQKLKAYQLAPRLMVDCSHANSRKDYRNQGAVWNDVLNQRLAGNEAIIGMMLESHLHPGRQELGADPSQLQYGVSITDGCIGWEETESLLLQSHAQLARATA